VPLAGYDDGPLANGALSAHFEHRWSPLGVSIGLRINVISIVLPRGGRVLQKLGLRARTEQPAGEVHAWSERSAVLVLHP